MGVFLFIFFSLFLREVLVRVGTLKPRTIMKTTQIQTRTIMKTLEMQPVETTTKTTKKKQKRRPTNEKQNVRNTNKKSPKQNVTKPPKNVALWQEKVINTTNAATPPYYALWNYTTHSIHVPNKRPGAPLTSLEILEQVLVDNDVGNITQFLPSCLVPNTENTQALADSGEPLQFPILNLGMPKGGSTTLQAFFNCAGWNTGHNQEGGCMERSLRAGKPPIAGCRLTKGKQALLQLDVQIPPQCFFPQISFLDEIHQEKPHATFVMNFRPVDDWIRSARAWNGGLANRWGRPDFISKIPGLVKDQGREEIKGEALTQQEIRNWLCGHVKHVREFVKQYPTHKLIELDLYDTEGSSKVMASLFSANETCWGQSNANKRLGKKTKRY
jgi:hypothetical protein